MLSFSEEHEWVYLVGDDEVTIGITDFAQQQLGDLVYIELPEAGVEIEKGESIGVIESVKAASDFIAPVSGTIIYANEELEDQPELVNEDAMKIWIIKVKLADKSQLDDLMTEKQYQDYTLTPE